MSATRRHLPARGAGGKNATGRHYRRGARWLPALATLFLLSCGSAEEEAEPPELEPAGGVPADTARELSPAEARLVAEAETVIRFLRGEVPFSDVRTADTVRLRLSPEGGGAVVAIPRHRLADPANWAIPSNGYTYVLVPPPELTQMTLLPGVHYNCLEQSLATRAPDLADLPHVGVRLTPEAYESCLQSWNLTLAFDTTAGRPSLVAALYDQWEW